MESPQSRPFPPATPIQPAWITNLELLAGDYDDNEANARIITTPPNTPINPKTQEEIERDVDYLLTRRFGLDGSACVPITYAADSAPSVLVTFGPEWSPPIMLPYRPHADEPFPTYEEWSYTRYGNVSSPQHSTNTVSQHRSISPPVNSHHSPSPPANPPNPTAPDTPPTKLTTAQNLWYIRMKPSTSTFTSPKK